jgi:hypothetical protein
METIRSGQIFALYLFDVAEAIDLTAATKLVGGSTRARLEPKAATPAYFQYQQPPLSFDGSAVDLPALDDFRISPTAVEAVRRHLDRFVARRSDAG